MAALGLLEEWVVVGWKSVSFPDTTRTESENSRQDSSAFANCITTGAFIFYIVLNFLAKK